MRKQPLKESALFPSHSLTILTSLTLSDFQTAETMHVMVKLDQRHLEEATICVGLMKSMKGLKFVSLFLDDISGDDKKNLLAPIDDDSRQLMEANRKPDSVQLQITGDNKCVLCVQYKQVMGDHVDTWGFYSEGMSIDSILDGYARGEKKAIFVDDEIFEHDLSDIVNDEAGKILEDAHDKGLHPAK